METRWISSYKKFCFTLEPNTIFMPENMIFDNSRLMCRKLGGSMQVVSSKEIQDKIAPRFEQFYNYCRSYWAGWTDEKHEWYYYDIHNHSRFLDNVSSSNGFEVPWNPGEPSGDNAENCIEVLQNGAWNDASCFTTTCTACEVPKKPVFVMRGLCPKSNFDSMYAWTRVMIPAGSREKYTLRGFSGTFLSWDDIKHQWNLTSTTRNQYVHAFNNETDNHGGYPFGTQNWYFVNDTCDWGIQVGPDIFKQEVSLSTCLDHQFNCHDGTW